MDYFEDCEQVPTFESGIEDQFCFGLWVDIKLWKIFLIDLELVLQNIGERFGLF